jgi:hypothetical protein
MEPFVPTRTSRRATVAFIGCFLIAVIYGITAKAPTSFVIVIMLGLSLVTGFMGGLKFAEILALIIKGMAGNVGLFLLFLLLDPFIVFIQQAGGFIALAKLIRPMMEFGGKPVIVITGGLLGAFGISGATVATLKLLHEMFAPLLSRYAISMLAWSLALVVATRVNNFVFPGANMVSSLGFAQSDDLKSMIGNGWVVASCQLTFLVIFSVFFA